MVTVHNHYSLLTDAITFQFAIECGNANPQDVCGPLAMTVRFGECRDDGIAFVIGQSGDGCMRRFQLKAASRYPWNGIGS